MLNNNHALDAAEQYLTWALEEIEKYEQEKAAQHVRAALEKLRNAASVLSEAETKSEASGRYAKKAKRFRDKADEAEQLQQSAATDVRRKALGNIAETYRHAAKHLEGLSDQLLKKGDT